jgi:NTE family protein
MKKYNTGLVLSGGAVRGFAHLGVLKALEKCGMRPDIISCVSAGAIAGALYCDGYSPEEILKIYNRNSLFEFMQITVPKTGIFKASGLRATLKKYLRAKSFEQLKIPLVVAATNLIEGRCEYFTQGQLVDIILASSCVPVLFEVVMINKIPYIDGGVMNNMPVEPLLNRCKKLIGVFINPVGQIAAPKGIVHIAERAFHLSVASAIKLKQPYFDIYIEPEEIAHYGLFDIKKAPKLYELGYQKTMQVLKKGLGTRDKYNADADSDSKLKTCPTKPWRRRKEEERRKK